jgi:hypothetical protein
VQFFDDFREAAGRFGDPRPFKSTPLHLLDSPRWKAVVLWRGSIWMSRIIFLSSVQRKFDKEREAIWDYVRGDALLGKHFEVFLFENNRSKAEVQ